MSEERQLLADHRATSSNNNFENQSLQVVRASVGSLPTEGKISKRVIIEEGGTLYVRNFQDVRVSTMTLVTFISGKVLNLDPIYFLLPARHPTKPRLPVATPGTITSVRHRDCYRGEPGSCFKNAVIINILTKEKGVSTKLSSCKIQMCGPRSTSMGEEAANYITSHVNESLEFLRAVRNNNEIYLRAVEWLCEHAKGESVVTHCPIESPEGVQYYRKIDNNCISWPEVSPPDELSYFVEQIIKRCDDHNFISELRGTCMYYPSLDPSSISEPLFVERVGRAMVNYNYQLGFDIDRLKLMKLLGENGIGVDYPNTVRSHVTIEVYGKKIDDPDVVRRDENCNKQVILIYFSGNVMQSGPGGTFMEQYYYRIVELIARNRHLVMSTCKKKEEDQHHEGSESERESSGASTPQQEMALLEHVEH